MIICFAGEKNAFSYPIDKLQQEIANILLNDTEAFENATDETQKTTAFGIKQHDIENSLKEFLKQNPDFTMQYNVVTPNFCTHALQDKGGHPRAPNLIEFSKMEQVKIVFDYINDISTDNAINSQINLTRVTCNQLKKTTNSEKDMADLLGATYTLYNPKTGERFSIGTSAVKQLPQAGEVYAEVPTLKPLAECIATAYSKNHEESLHPPFYINVGTGERDKILNNRSVAFKVADKEVYAKAERQTALFVRENAKKHKPERIEKLANYSMGKITFCKKV